MKKLDISPHVIVIDGDNAVKNAIEEVYPSVPTILCVWHVDNCVLSNCKKDIGEDDWLTFFSTWRDLRQSATIDEYNEKWQRFQSTYSSGPPAGRVRYLEQEWLRPGQRERLVTAWTSRYRHFGTLVTSRHV